MEVRHVKMSTICGGQISLHNVPLRYTERICRVLRFMCIVMFPTSSFIISSHQKEIWNFEAKKF
jgi:hypothetical protein